MPSCLSIENVVPPVPLGSLASRPQRFLPAFALANGRRRPGRGLKITGPLRRVLDGGDWHQVIPAMLGLDHPDGAGLRPHHDGFGGRCGRGSIALAFWACLHSPRICLFPTSSEPGRREVLNSKAESRCSMTRHQIARRRARPGQDRISGHRPSTLSSFGNQAIPPVRSGPRYTGHRGLVDRSIVGRRKAPLHSSLSLRRTGAIPRRPRVRR